MRPRICSSRAGTGSFTANTMSVRSASRIALLARFMPSCSSPSAASLRPAVSIRVKACCPSINSALTVSRVVPGVSETMAASWPERAFIIQDLPALGGPAMTTAGVCCSLWPALALASRSASAARQPLIVASSGDRSGLTSSSSGKSSAASTVASARRIRSFKAPTSLEKTPSSERAAASAACLD